MKKIFLSMFVVMMSLMNSAYAMPPVIDLSPGESMVGYSFSNLNDNFNNAGESTDFTNAKQNGFYAETALSNKWNLGVDYATGDANKSVWGQELKLEHEHMDIYVQYKLSSNCKAILGMREYGHNMYINGVQALAYDKKYAIYGLAANTKFNQRWNGYGAVIRNKVETDFQIGTTYALTKDVFLDINYKSNVFEDTSVGNLKLRTTGIGFGVGGIF